MPDKPLTVSPIGPLEFRAVYADEEVLCHVRFITDSEGEEHVVSLLPLWENQRIKIAQAFGRETVPDESRPSKDNVISIKSADGSPPDPTFERTLTYTLGNETNEFSVRVRKGETTRELKEGLKRRRAGIHPSKILFEGSEMDDADPVTDWATTTGTSPLKVKVTLDTSMQKFWLWQQFGQYDLGSEELDGRSRDEMWRSLQLRNPLLGEFKNYRLFRGQEEVSWENLPVLDMVIVPNEIPVVCRGIEFKIVDHLRVNRPRSVGPLTQMSYQIFTMDKTPIDEPVVIHAPNEITLSQLVAHFILPTGIQLDVSSVFYWNLREIEPPEEKNPKKDKKAPKEDKARREIEQIPTKTPPGFNLRVKCSSLPVRTNICYESEFGRLSVQGGAAEYAEPNRECGTKD
jgi:hypothetical protein